jgi:hypothetical protein
MRNGLRAGCTMLRPGPEDGSSGQRQAAITSTGVGVSVEDTAHGRACLMLGVVGRGSECLCGDD